MVGRDANLLAEPNRQRTQVNRVAQNWMKWDSGRTAARNETRLLALEERSSEIHRRKRAAEDRVIRRRKKRERTGEDLAGDDMQADGRQMTMHWITAILIT